VNSAAATLAQRAEDRYDGAVEVQDEAGSPLRLRDKLLAAVDDKVTEPGNSAIL
jgi:hypothetical protein